MHRKLSGLIRNLVKATRFWQDNYVILREFKHFPRIALLAVVFSFLAASFEGVSIGFLLSFLQSLTTPDAKPIQSGIEWFDIFVLGIHTSATSRLYRISGLILLSSWIRSAFNYLSEFYIKTSEIKLVDRLRIQTFEQLQSLSLSYFTKTKGGELINTITTETERVKQFFGGVAFFFTRSLTAIVYMLSILLLSWQLTIISILLFSLLAVGLSTLNARVREASFEISRASGHFTSRAIEFINGIRTVQAFSTQDFERTRYCQASDELVQASTKVVMLSAMVKPLAEAFASTILIGMIIVAFTGLITHQALPVSSLLTFFFLLFRLVPIIQELNGGIAFLSTMQGAADNIKNLLRSEDKEYFKNGTLEFTGLERAIEFVDVDFGYDAENLVLRNITLMIERGKMTALVGASGAGKTTLADLIPRFYDPIRGEVLIDGVDVHKFDINTLRRKMAVVSQDTFIFNTSVRNNIAYGTENASDEAIIEAARLANAVDFIKEMPNGFDTQLGDRGVRLSGGQRQRIAIARALLRNPEILILDEATSALDSVSERLIQESLEKLSVGRTVIAIAHRLSTIVRADKVVVLEQGRIVEQGNYQELLEQRGKLWNYHQMQHESGYVG